MVLSRRSIADDFESVNQINDPFDLSGVSNSDFTFRFTVDMTLKGHHAIADTDVKIDVLDPLIREPGYLDFFLDYQVPQFLFAGVLILCQILVMDALDNQLDRHVERETDRVDDQIIVERIFPIAVMIIFDETGTLLVTFADHRVGQIRVDPFSFRPALYPVFKRCNNPDPEHAVDIG